MATEKPPLYPWLHLTRGLTLFMSFMELVPGSGTLAASVIALVAAAILPRDEMLLALTGICVGGLAWVLRWLGVVTL